MSILIKGMDMPKACIECGLRDVVWGNYTCAVSGEIIKNELDRPNDCPLVNIPTPHGRLIGGDRLIAVLKSTTSISQSDYGLFNHVIGLIEHQPTIIEAEGKS